MSEPEATSATARAAPASRVRWAEVPALAQLTLQLAVLWLLCRAFRIEHASFYEVVLPLAFGGFLVHHWLPRRLQAWFFVALSGAGIGLVFEGAGWWIPAVGLVLIGLCHAPLAYRWRVLLVLTAAGALVAMRASWLPTPWPGAVWPILGSMFMFRLGLYLYDLKHQAKPAGAAMVLSYFFMLPNTVFLLFPVIDWQTFRRTYFDKPALVIYGEGVRWMFRGLLHLVAYRIVYQNLFLAPADATTTAGIVQYLVANFGLYLRVSGQFHFIVGLLHLFGFRLPESHRFFYLASSFTDLWRRINIYWKDFMQKVVYLPVVFALKRQGETTRLVLATALVVVVTWTLHSYQWFWLLGTWLFSATDTAFWGVIGVFLIASTLIEQRRGRVRQLSAQAKRQAGWGRAVQTAGMFGLMALMWGMWTAPTFGEFGALLSAATLRAQDAAAVLGVLGAVAVAAFVTQRFALGAPSALGGRRSRWQHPLVSGALPLALLWAAGSGPATGRVPGELSTLALKARGAELNTFDAERLQRGYYEEIVGLNRFNGELWEVYARGEQRPAPADPEDPEDVEQASLGVFVDDGYGNRSLQPSRKSELKGQTVTTNRWGMRDQDYPREPGPGTRRFAVLGPSFVMGTGVGDEDTFEHVLENLLNGEWPGRAGRRFELLNFGLPRASLVEIASIVDSGRVAGFEPDVVLVVSNMYAWFAVQQDFWRRKQLDQPLPDALAQRLPAGFLEAATSRTELNRSLAPHAQAILEWALVTIADAARRMGAVPVYAQVPLPYESAETFGKLEMPVLARDAGFTVIDARDVFEGLALENLVVDSADHHPNAAGHRVIADRLYSELTASPEVVGD
jgi:D-alanyl-lipoteichoic acid acyltransferase DltB (MBOAT superfamily)